MKNQEAVAAVIVHEKNILCVRNSTLKSKYEAGKYEFPGGKIKKGETEENAVTREVREETGLTVRPLRKLLTVHHDYPDMHLTMHTWLCFSKETVPQLEEHDDYKWLSPRALTSLDWAPAEWKVVEFLKDFLFT